MKSNQSSKNLKSVSRIFTIVICVGLAFSLIAVQESDAILGIAIGFVAVFVAGAIIGWLANSGHDSSSPDALVTSQENYVLTWNDFLEDWNNDYIDENVDLHNYMMMYNLTYLDSVRRAEHDVANYVNLLNWLDVESNMTSLLGYKENVTGFIVSTLHGYNRIDVSILQHIYDTDAWSYTTPMKYGLTYNGLSSEYLWKNLFLHDGYTGGIPFTAIQYQADFGTYPTGYNGSYNIGDKFYVTYIYVPNGNFITLKNLESDVETNYSHGVYDLQGERNEVIDVTMYDYGNYLGTNINAILDTNGAYLFGVPTDFDMLEDIFISYNPNLGTIGQIGYSPIESQSIEFEKNKFIKDITFCESADMLNAKVELYIDGLNVAMADRSETITYTHNNYADNITIITNPEAIGRIISITTEGYIYSDMTGGLRVDTDSAGSVYITDSLPARGRIGLDWMVNSYKDIYDAMIVNAKILWNLYHANGWYSTDDIPSEFLIVPPDIIFDNMDALKNLPLDKAQAIYYTWMKQLIDYYDENPNATGVFDDTNITMFDDGIIINATLVHGVNTIFDNHQIYISPLLGDLELCKNYSYNLTQKIFIYDITATYIYYGYVGDNLTIHNISIEGVETDCVTLGRQTMHDFLMGKYGFSISFPAEWQFPEIENIEIYMGIAIACIGFGIPIAIFGKKFKPIGYLLLVIGCGIIVFIYVIPAIKSLIDYLIFWE